MDGGADVWMGLVVPEEQIAPVPLDGDDRGSLLVLKGSDSVLWRPGDGTIVMGRRFKRLAAEVALW